MDHKERCKQLKAMRKEMADKIGLELNQTQCQYKGECPGTCPKCQQEERKLNKALLSGVLVATGVMLTACGSEDMAGGVQRAQRPRESHVGASRSNRSNGVLSSMWRDFTTNGDDGTIEGDVEILEGEAMPAPDIDYEGGFDYVDDTLDSSQIIEQDTILEACAKYSGASDCQVDYYDGDLAMVTCYDKSGNSASQNMCDYITVDIYTGVAKSLSGEEFNILGL